MAESLSRLTELRRSRRVPLVDNITSVSAAVKPFLSARGQRPTETIAGIEAVGASGAVTLFPACPGATAQQQEAHGVPEHQGHGSQVEERNTATGEMNQTTKHNNNMY